MSGLFNGNSTNSQGNVAKGTVPQDAPVKGDFSAAIESIGAAIGELKEILPDAIGKSFGDAIASDSTNNALYDAIASATYDSISDLYEDGKLGGMQSKSAIVEPDNVRGFTLSQLLAVETLDTNERLVGTLVEAIGRSTERNGSGNNGDELASGTGAVTSPAHGGRTDAATSESVGVNDSTDADEIKLGTGVVPDNSEIHRESAGTQGNKPDAGSEQAVNSSKDNSAPVEHATGNENNVSSGFVDSRKKMLDDMTLNFMSRTAPEFMAKGNDTFDKILNDDLTVHLDEDIGDNIGGAVSNAMKGLPWGSMLKGGSVMALGAATIASLGMIATAGKQLWDWHKARTETDKNIDQSVANSEKANTQRKNGINDDMRDANIMADRANAELEKERSNSFKSSLLGAFGIKTDAVIKKEGEAAEANAKQQIEMRRYRELLDRAEAYGVKRTDTEGVKKWLEEQKRLATDAGVNVEDRGAFIKFQVEELSRYKESQKRALDDGTRPNGRDTNARWTNVRQPIEREQNTQPGRPDISVPLAAGSNTNDAVNTVNAGTGVMTDDIITSEERARQYKMYTFEGIRDALLLPEVQAMFSATARTAGASVEQKLMG